MTIRARVVMGIRIVQSCIALAAELYSAETRVGKSA
jgi:hypothetical protein